MHRFNYSRTLLQRSSRQGCITVNPGIQWRFIAPGHTLITLTIWNFNSLFRVCLIFFTTYWFANFKSIGNNTMKKNVTCHCAGPAYYRMCSIDYRSKQTGSSSTKRKPSPIISSFLELGRRKPSRCSQNLWRRRKCCWNRNPANIRKWIARFYYFRYLYSAGSVRIAHGDLRVAHRYGQPICTAH